ncbi:hypothetical protein, partial [Paracidovorax sp. MALMAid1276]|uniref:hypothetical protein n=1 Tax=Paracidovorax sp. MALMAid1276 TaxID=3411631 RepID=UPI003B9C7962
EKQRSGPPETRYHEPQGVMQDILWLQANRLLGRYGPGTAAAWRGPATQVLPHAAPLRLSQKLLN